MTKKLTPTEAIECLRDFIPVVVDVLVSQVEEDSRGQTARVTFNEDTHPLIKLLVDELGDRLPTKQFTMLLIELDDSGHPVDIVRRAKIRRLMGGQGKCTKEFFALCGNEDFQRWLYAHENQKHLAGCQSKSERADVARVWAEAQGIEPAELDIDHDQWTLFNQVMKQPYYAHRAKRLADNG